MEHPVKRAKLEWNAKTAWEALEAEDVPQLEALLKIGNPDEFEMEDCPLLHFAATSGSLNIVKCLVENGAKVNMHGSSHYNTALFEAIDNGNTEITRYLIENGADVNAQDKEGATNLIYASGDGNLEAARILIENGADVNHTNENRHSSLNAALHHRFFDMANFLIKKGADINAYGEYGYTRLEDAIIANRIDTVKFILEHGADVNKKNERGCPAFMVYTHNKPIMELLIKNGALVNTKDSKGETWLHCIAKYGNPDDIDFLVGNGADVYVRDNTDMTLADHSLKSEHPALTPYFLEKGVQLSRKSFKNIFDRNFFVRRRILALLPPRDRKALCELPIEDFKDILCKIPIQKAVSLLIGREMCPASPFHSLPLDLLKVIFDMCGFLPLYEK